MLEFIKKKSSLEMPEVKTCEIQNCGYNVNSSCHAKAITIGDLSHPGCDTYLGINHHIKETKRVAGVGACKISHCKFNNDYECSAKEICVGLKEGKINCLTFTERE